ncbi:hypothetical protein MHYP_G00213700 [Metynnis hypsauchen]
MYKLFPSKTRCCFLQYIATKPDKFGIKFWLACDLKSKYICNVFPYLGKDPSRPSGERVSKTVVMRLMEPFMDKGRTVTTDNFFTSLSLAQRLLSRKTTILGTVNKSRREIPQSAREMDRTEFTTQVFSTTGATLTVYAPKRRKAVYVLSSMHSVVETEDTTKRKPNMVTQYNKTKCGVDVMDQMVQEYSACTGVQERRVDFLVELAKELGDSHVSEKKAHKEKLLRQQPSTPSPGRRAKCQVNHRSTNNCATVRCVDCYKYTCGKCTRDTAWQCQAKFHITGDVRDRPRSGHPKKTTAQEDCFLTLSVLRYRRLSSTDLQSRFAGRYGRRLSAQTIWNRLHAANLRSHSAARRPAMTAFHCQTCLRWCLQHVHWNLNMWRNDMFSDESRFCLRQLDRRVKVWGRRRECYSHCCTDRVTYFGRDSVMVWGGIFLTRKTRLVIIGGNLNAER